MQNQKANDFAGVDGSVEEDFTLIHAKVPYRKTPDWPSASADVIHDRNQLINVTNGELPLGILPGLVIPDEERKQLVQSLLSVPVKKYEGTSDEQSVKCWGQPLVDAKSITEHLTVGVEPMVHRLTQPLVRRIERWLLQNGFNVTKMIDPFTGLSYHAGIFRSINVVNHNSVLHVDDFIRDATKKDDFRFPYLLADRLFYQVSFNILLDDGGHKPDSLYVHNKMYDSSHEKHVLENGWQFPVCFVSDRPYYKHIPRVGETYVFSTSNYHDVRGGSPLSRRITFSCFGIYIPDINLFMLYN